MATRTINRLRKDLDLEAHPSAWGYIEIGEGLHPGNGQAPRPCTSGREPPIWYIKAGDIHFLLDSFQEALILARFLHQHNIEFEDKTPGQVLQKTVRPT